MERVNDLHVPALKALNQIESSFYLLESDLDKSYQEGILRPKDSLESVLNSRLDLLDRMTRSAGDKDTALRDGVQGLRRSFGSCVELLNKVYLNWHGRAVYEADLSARRGEFRTQLKALALNLDQEMRAVSVSVQSELRRLRLVLTFALAACALSAFLTTFWLASSLRPLGVLAEVMRSISERGLGESVVRRLADLPEVNDEIGTLSRESFQMASSLLDKNKILRDQKQNLERAHFELARQNEELKSTQNKLLHSEKLGLVGRMAAQMAHEIRNPLNALNLHAELLQQQLRADPRALESLSPLQKEINRLITVTESYLDLARAPRLQKSEVQINDVVEELQELYGPLLREREIYLTCDLGDVPLLAADRGQVSQVVGNLLKNASEAFDGLERPGAKYIRVITQHNLATREVVITVMDNGIGIEDENRKNIYSPFYTNKAHGTGLGLTFSRQVIEAHGGSISFDSAYQQGTKFTIKLPAAGASVERGERWKATELRS
jgi:signal transduction histidine kinase